MTESELQFMRLKTRADVHEMLLRALFRRFSRSDPEFADWKAVLFRDAMTIAETQTAPSLPAEYADLATSEYREALRDLIEFIEK